MLQYLRTFFSCLIILGVGQGLFADTEMYLKDNLQKARPGDYIVTSINKTYSLLHVYDKKDNILFLEEINVPENRIKLNQFSWRKWVESNAPSNTSWVMYEINLETGQMPSMFSFTKNGWYSIPQAENFLSTILNLKLSLVPDDERRKVGPPPDLFGPDHRKLWQPKMVVDGKEIPGVKFDAWKTHWPKDGTELSNLGIEIYTPAGNDKYPAYFPYWLQISGNVVGKAKIFIIDSGTGLKSPKPSLSSLKGS
jgi:hypothetical protein